MTEPTTHTLDVPGAVLTYDVREPARSPATTGRCSSSARRWGRPASSSW